MTDIIESKIKATLVNNRQRMSFLPMFFGKNMLRGEALIYNWAEKLASSYNGGYWDYYTLSNGGFYLSLDSNEVFQVECYGNFFRGELSADAMGIVATLYTLCQLANETHNEELIDHYHHLRDYASQHRESALIYAAID